MNFIPGDTCSLFMKRQEFSRSHTFKSHNQADGADDKIKGGGQYFQDHLIKYPANFQSLPSFITTTVSTDSFLFSKEVLYWTMT